MPIYAYRCSACGHAKDVLQRLSDPVLTDCPACGAQEFAKQLTAAGFQLKGSGWYATDFRDNGKKPATPAAEEGAPAASDAKPAPAGDAPASGASDASTPAAAKPAPAATPASTPAAPAPSAPASP